MEEPEVYTCASCSKVFTGFTAEKFKKHVEKCRAKCTSCNICSMKFSSNITLNRHVKTVHDKCMPYECETCGKGFSTKYAMNVHETRHFDEEKRERFSCDYCDKTFAWKSSASRHLQTHISNDIKAYVCSCGKAFQKYSELYAHKIACPVNKGKNVTSITDGNSQETEELHGKDQGTEIHSCQYCGLKFYDRQQLSDHVDGCNPFTCTISDTNSEQGNQYRSKGEDGNTAELVKSIEKATQKDTDFNDIIIEINNSSTPEDRDESKHTVYEEIADKESVDSKESQHSEFVAKKTNHNVDLESVNDEEKSSQNCDETGRSKRKRKPKQFADYETDLVVSTYKSRSEVKIPSKKDIQSNKILNKTCSPKRFKSSNEDSDITIKVYIDTRISNDDISLKAVDKKMTNKKHKQSNEKHNMDIENDDIYDPEYKPLKGNLEEGLSDNQGMSAANSALKGKKRKHDQKPTSKTGKESVDVEYICKTDNCNKRYSLRSKLVQHKKETHKEKLQCVCSNCKKTFGTAAILKSHLRMSHFTVDFVKLAYKNVQLRSKKDDKLLSLPICTKCGTTVKFDTMDSHICKFSLHLSFFCPYCECKETTYPGIKNHLHENHPNEKHTVTHGHKYASMRNQSLNKALLDMTRTTTLCGICQEQFASHNELLSHINKKHACLPLCCGVCLQCYGRRSAIMRHMMVHNNSQFECSICNKGFYEKKVLEAHMRFHDGERPFKCDLCDKTYCDKKSLRKHIQIHHPFEFNEMYKDTKAVQKLSADSQGCICPICGFMCANPSKLDKHIFNHDNKKSLQCPQCDKTYSTPSKLRYHMVVHKAGRAELNRHEHTTQIVSVNTTTEMRKLMLDLKEVDETHSSGKPYSCRACNKRFRKVKLLNQHIHSMHIEDRVKNCICRICNRGFPRFSLLKTHLRVHTNSRPYRCRLCHKTYKQVAHVREHLRAHGKSLFTCRYCTKAFKTTSRLASHILVHCTIFPFVCPEETCKQPFSSIIQLLHHQADCQSQDPPDKQYMCNICNQAFQSSNDVILHLYKHENEGLFPCEVCGNKMNSFRSLYFHKVKFNHFVDGELESNDKSKLFKMNGVKSTIDELDLDMSVEALMSQYDYTEDEEMEPETKESLEHVEEAGIVEETYGHEAEELIVIAEQLTNMASGVDQFTEVVVSEQPQTLQYTEPVPHQPEEPHVILMESNTPSHLGYPAIMLKEDDASIQYEAPKTCYNNLDTVDDTVDELSETVPSACELFKVEKPPSANEKLNDLNGLQDFEGEIMEATGNITKGNSSFVPFSAESLQISYENHSSGKLTEAKNEYSSSDIVFDMDSESQLDYNSLLETLNADDNIGHIKVVDTLGNLVTVFVNNDNGEQEQVTDIHEILKSVLHTGKYKIQCSVKQVEEDHNGDIKPHSSTYVIVLAEKEDKLQITQKENPILQTHMKKTVKSEKDRIRNVRKIHGEFVEDDKNTKNNETNCEFNYKANLNYYVQKDASTHPFRCEQCGLRFVNLKSLNGHKKNHLPNEERRHKCNVCGAGFNVPSSLRIHMRCHTGEKPYTCQTCGARFRQRGHLQVHMRGHQEYFPFKCTVCGNQYRTNSHLRIHMQKHTAPSIEKEFSCAQCSSEFITKQELLCHQFMKHLSTDLQKNFLQTCNLIENKQTDNQNGSIDKGETIVSKIKNNICDICGFVSKHDYAFKLHRQRHDSSTDFKCEQCGKGFSSGSLLKEHLRLYHADLYPCEVCGDQIRGKKSLKNHLLRKHKIGTSKFECQRCKEFFSSQGEFFKHVSSCMKNELKQFMNAIC